MTNLVMRPGSWLIVLAFFCNSANGQSYEDLTELKGTNIKTYFSSGAGDKAKRMTNQLEGVIAFYDEHLDFIPTVTLLVLSSNDWSNYTSFPVYGMPHYTNNKTLVVAGDDNAYWKSMLPPVDKIPGEYVKEFSYTYSGNDRELTMEPFFDLLAIHELGHAYSSQGGLVVQRKWMGELFCNILLHGYIAEKEPSLLAALTIFPKMVIATTDKSSLEYTSLEELEMYYSDIGPKHPQNYGWYQCRWHVAAGNIYDQSKMSGIKNLWIALKYQKEVLGDPQFVDLLHRVHPSLAAVPRQWNDPK